MTKLCMLKTIAQYYLGTKLQIQRSQHLMENYCKSGILQMTESNIIRMSKRLTNHSKNIVETPASNSTHLKGGFSCFADSY